MFGFKKKPVAPPPQPRLAIVTAYLGKCPFYTPALLVSCRAHPDVNWVFYTDFDVPDTPPNVRVVPTSLSQLTDRFSDVVGARVALNPKKLNDLKPTYGLAFADDLKDFDFWAYSDLDVVWGDIRAFMTNERFAQYDVLSSRPDKLSGHFTAFRNTPRVNRLFEVIPNMQAQMTMAQHLKLDEKGFTAPLRQHVDKSGTGPRIYWEEELSTNAEYQRSLSDGPDGALWWKHGKTFTPDGRELMYIHFHKLKQTMDTVTFRAADTPDTFSINRRGFFA